MVACDAAVCPEPLRCADARSLGQSSPGNPALTCLFILLVGMLMLFALEAFNIYSCWYNFNSRWFKRKK